MSGGKAEGNDNCILWICAANASLKKKNQVKRSVKESQGSESGIEQSQAIKRRKMRSDEWKQSCCDTEDAEKKEKRKGKYRAKRI